MKPNLFRGFQPVSTTHQPWLLDLKRHGRGPSASSVDHSSLPSFGHHRGHRGRGAQFTPPKGKISVATSCCHLWLFVQKPNIASSSLPQHQSLQAGTMPAMEPAMDAPLLVVAVIAHAPRRKEAGQDIQSFGLSLLWGDTRRW